MTSDETPVVVLRIGRKWSPGMDEDEVYETVRGWWRIGARRDSVQYGVAVALGQVRGVYEVSAWGPRHMTDSGTAVRWGFDGRPAAGLRHLVGTDVSGLFSPGDASPVRYCTLGALRLLAASPVGRGPEVPTSRRAEAPRPVLRRLRQGGGSAEPTAATGTSTTA